MPHVERIVDGVKWPSVTEALHQEEPAWATDWKAREHKKNPRWGLKRCQAKLQRGGRIGTDTHTVLEWFLHNPDLWAAHSDCFQIGRGSGQWVYTG